MSRGSSDLDRVGGQLTVEPRHEDDAVDAHPPLLDEHHLGFLPEGGRRLGFLTLPPRVEELLRLGKQAADQTHADGQTCTDPEDRLPAIGRTTDAKIGTRGAHVAKRVALLQDS